MYQLKGVLSQLHFCAKKNFESKVYLSITMFVPIF